MPPKRTTRSKSDSEPAVKKKKAVLAVEDRDTLDANQIQWQYEEKANQWMIFNKTDQADLTNAYNDNLENCTLAGDEFCVEFTKLVRKTVKSGYSKRVRIAVKNSSDNQFNIWYWIDGRKKKRFYDVSSTTRLEENPDSDSLDLVSEGKACDVNADDMSHEDRYKVVREISDAKQAAMSADSGKATDTSAVSKVVDSVIQTQKSKGKKKEAEEETKERSVVMEGKAPVDPECTLKVGKATVHYEGNTIWDCMLNQTNLQNNNNKYYVVQLLKDKSVNAYNVWNRWGRVGKAGQTALHACGPNLDEAKKVFCKKFRDKTGNDWSAGADAFRKIPGKYDMVAIDYSTDNTTTQTDEPDSGPPAKTPDSTLDKPLQTLIKLIADVKAMEQAVVEMKYDCKKAPLGKLTKAQIKAGYEALKRIEELLKKNDHGFALTQACNDFYTRIPHDFGMHVPDKINTNEKLQSKINLLQALDDIQVAVKLMSEKTGNINPIDHHYLSLKCELRVMKKSSDRYKLLEKYMFTNVGPTHSHYTMKLLDIFECNKDGEEPPSVHNRMLLWHGSRITNWVGILATGLRIAPPEAPVTGYMFGKGVYFADCTTKSANYCFATQSNNTGLLVLCEVGIGEPNKLLCSKYDANKLPAGTHSTKGCGRYAPSEDSAVLIDDGVTVPVGKMTDPGGASGSLLYNEYIVYNTKQVRMRYLMKVKFQY